MNKIVYFLFGDNWNRHNYLLAWKKRNPKAAAISRFVEVRPGMLDSRAKRFGVLFLHDGSNRSQKGYARLKKYGIPHTNMRAVLQREAEIAAAGKVVSLEPTVSEMTDIEVMPNDFIPPNPSEAIAKPVKEEVVVSPEPVVILAKPEKKTKAKKKTKTK